jgi:molybdopterin molybdotransferase
VVTGLSAREAAGRILAALELQPTLRVPLETALGSVLAEPVVSPINVPFWANSAMDGYAVRAEDVRGASPERPKRLTVIEEIPAGAFPARPIGPGQASRIFTGAPLPEGADSVIRQEDTDQGDPTVAILGDRDCGVNLRRAGEDIPSGTTVLEPGVELQPAHLGILASLAVSHPVVYRRPRVAILGSGDEIVDVDRPDEILSGRKIASSNTHTLRALVRLAGGEPVNLGIAADDVGALRQLLARATECDLLVTSAGISVGEHDHLRTAIESLGGRLDFWKIRIRPGAPVGFGTLGDLPWIGLPGNPVSTMVTFELLVRPAIRALMGNRLPFRQGTPVRVVESITLGPRLQHFLRAVVTRNGEASEARLTGPQGSGILMSMVLANALVIVPEGHHETPAGTVLDAIVLDDPRHRPDPPF